MAVIEPPRLEEREMLVALTRATGFFHEDEVEIVEEMLADYAAHPDDEEYTWIVYRDEPEGTPLGYACYGPASMAVGTFDLYWIAVAPEAQGKRIGSALLDFVEGDLRRRNGRQVYIETSDTEQYAPTRAFYLRRGYREVAHFRDYYDVGDGKVVFLKEIRNLRPTTQREY